MNFAKKSDFQRTVNLDEAMHNPQNPFNLRVRSQPSSVTMAMPIKRLVRLQTLSRDKELSPWDIVLIYNQNLLPIITRNARE